MFQFTFHNLKGYFEEAIAGGYRIMTCEEYVSYKQRPVREEKVLINRVDIDLSCRKAKRIANSVSRNEDTRHLFCPFFSMPRNIIPSPSRIIGV